MVFICVPIFNRLNFTISFLESLKKQTFKEFKVVLCDDNSSDGTFEIISAMFPEEVILKGDGNLWWTGGINACVEYSLKCSKSEFDFILTLNNDTELEVDTIEKLVDFSLKNGRCIVGGVNLFYKERNKIEPSGFVKKGKFPFSKYHEFVDRWGDDLDKKNKFAEVDSLSGKGVLIPIEIFRKVGLYNFEKLPHYHADTEFIRRAKSITGVRVFLLYSAFVYSHQDQSGIGQINTPPTIFEFLNSFFNLKSTNHFVTLRNRAKLIYLPHWKTYLIFNVLKIVLGFTRRYIIYKYLSIVKFFKRV